MFGFLKKRVPYFACVEYWVYLPTPKLPPQDLIMGRMLRSNPFKVEGKSPIGPPEGLLFSDIRLHGGLVLKQKNLAHFRPDLFDPLVEPSQEALAQLAGAHAFANLRYMSKDRLRDDRHLRFMPYFAEATAYYGKAGVLFDVVQERLWTLESFRGHLMEDPMLERLDFHARVAWIAEGATGRAVTRGLIKVGLPELETPETDQDHRTLVVTVMNEALQRLWAEPTPTDELRVRAFEEPYVVQMRHRRGLPTLATIVRG